MNVVPPLPYIKDSEIRHIPGWAGYAITNNGDVWTCIVPGPNRKYTAHYSRYNKWHKRKATVRKLSGHLWVRLHDGNRRISTYVHRLVLIAFVGPCPKGYEARHLDNNPSNNCLSNLQWNTRKVNQRDRFVYGTQTPKGPDGRFMVVK